MNDLMKAAQALVDAVNFDVSGVNGKGGNGGLVSTETIRAADALRWQLERAKAAPQTGVGEFFPWPDDEPFVAPGVSPFGG